MIEAPRLWHHSPAHLLLPNVTYMVTAGTLHKEHFFRDSSRLRMLHDLLLDLAQRYGWQLQAWAVFSNHYHWIGAAPEEATTLKTFVGTRPETPVGCHPERSEGSQSSGKWWKHQRFFAALRMTDSGAIGFRISSNVECCGLIPLRAGLTQPFRPVRLDAPALPQILRVEPRNDKAASSRRTP